MLFHLSFSLILIIDIFILEILTDNDNSSDLGHHNFSYGFLYFALFELFSTPQFVYEVIVGLASLVILYFNKFGFSFNKEFYFLPILMIILYLKDKYYKTRSLRENFYKNY